MSQISPIEIHSNKHVLIAGPTASGKSSLALEIAENQGGLIVNADAMQVFDGWRIVTARPSDEDLGRATHALYGHVPHDQFYSVGEWLRDLEPLLKNTRLIVVGGTGLYLSALTEGLANIPETPLSIREEADERPLDELISDLDPIVFEKIDLANRARVQRAWEVKEHTGKSIADWQKDMPTPLLDMSNSVPICLDAPKEWLTPRIEQRFDQMLDMGALDEAREMLPSWDPTNSSSKAIGTSELIAHLQGDLTLEQAREKSIIASRQYAKRQRTWFRKRMNNWNWLEISSTDLSTALTYKT